MTRQLSSFLEILKSNSASGTLLLMLPATDLKILLVKANPSVAEGWNHMKTCFFRFRIKLVVESIEAKLPYRANALLS